MPRKHAVSWHQPKTGAGRWRFSKTDEGGKRRFFYASAEIPNTSAGKRKATVWMESVLVALSDRIVTGDNGTLDDLRVAYLTWYQKKVREDEGAEHSFIGHRKHLNLICRTTRGGTIYGQVIAKDLTTKMVADLIKQWKGRGATTIRNRVGSLQAMLNWAAKPRDDRTIERLIPVNPIAGFELPKSAYQGDRYAPAEEVERFLAWVEERAARAKGATARFEWLTGRLVRFVAETGCRPGEACILEWEMVREDLRAIVIPWKRHKTGRKTRRDRIILLSPETLGLLAGIKEEANRHPTRVFTHAVHRAGSTEEERRHGDPWNSNALSRKVKELRREAIAAGILSTDSGLKRMHLYRLRHSMGTNLVQSGVSLSDAAAMMGNSAKTMENTYLHNQLDHLHEVFERMRKREE